MRAGLTILLPRSNIVEPIRVICNQNNRLCAEILRTSSRLWCVSSDDVIILAHKIIRQIIRMRNPIILSSYRFCWLCQPRQRTCVNIYTCFLSHCEVYDHRYRIALDSRNNFFFIFFFGGPTFFSTSDCTYLLLFLHVFACLLPEKKRKLSVADQKTNSFPKTHQTMIGNHKISKLKKKWWKKNENFLF